MKKARKTITISVYEPHKKLLSIWAAQTGMGPSALIRALLEQFSNWRFEKDGLFGLELRPPKYQREEA